MKKQGNKGLSLIELVATIAIMAIVSVAIVSFLMISMRHYEKAENQVNLQQESQLVMNQIQELVVDATNGIAYEPGKLIIYNKNTKTGESEKIELVKDDNRILYTRYTLDAALIWRTDDVSRNQPFADFVKDFSVTLYDTEGQAAAVETEPKEIGQVAVHIEFEWNGETFEADNVITLRNTVVASTNIEKIFTDIAAGSVPNVTGVAIRPGSISVWAGALEIPFSAEVMGTNLTDSSVEWTLSGNSSGNTKITDAGLLTVGTEETNDFAIKATAVADNRAVGVARVNVKSIEGLYIYSFSQTSASTASAYLTVSGKNLEGVLGEADEIADRLGVNFMCDGEIVDDITCALVSTQLIDMESYMFHYEVYIPDTYLDKVVTMNTTCLIDEELSSSESITFKEYREREATGLHLYRSGVTGLQEREVTAYPGGRFNLSVEADFDDGTHSTIDYADEALEFTIASGREYVALDNLKENGTITFKGGDVPEGTAVTVVASYKGAETELTFLFKEATLVIRDKTPDQEMEFITTGRLNAATFHFEVTGIEDYKIECVDSQGMHASVGRDSVLVYTDVPGDYELTFTLVDRSNGCVIGNTDSILIHAGEPNLKYKKWSIWNRKYIFYDEEPAMYIPSPDEWGLFTEGRYLYSLGNVNQAALRIEKTDNTIIVNNTRYEWEDGAWVTDRTFE